MKCCFAISEYIWTDRNEIVSCNSFIDMRTLASIKMCFFHVSHFTSSRKGVYFLSLFKIFIHSHHQGTFFLWAASMGRKNSETCPVLCRLPLEMLPSGNQHDLGESDRHTPAKLLPSGESSCSQTCEEKNEPCHCISMAIRETSVQLPH